MAKRLISAAVGLAALATATIASAEPPFYISGSFGGYFKEDQEGTTTFGHSSEPDEPRVPGTIGRSFDPGEIAAFAIGYRFRPHLRVEGEFQAFTYTTGALHPFTSSPGFSSLNGQAFRRDSGSRYERYAGTANVFYDFSPVAGRFTPYVGGGVGGSANHSSDGFFTADGGSRFTARGGSSTRGLGQVEGGVAVALTPHLSLVPAYRYVHFFASGEDVAHVAKIGLRYSF